jgi:alcohol dehydrogenase class IV
MTSFNYFQPTEIRFGEGAVSTVADAVAGHGDRCLLVTTKSDGSLADSYAGVVDDLRSAGIRTSHFDGIRPDPTTSIISAGAAAATQMGANVILGMGGGSSMDAAKAIAVEVTHDGTAWDYRWCSETQPTESTLPVIAVPTTSGTGSEVTQVSVLTNPDLNEKSAIYNTAVYPKVAVIDPDLTSSLPASVTAESGFDAFAHAFEALLHRNSSPYSDLLANEAVTLVIRHLRRAVADGGDRDARRGMSWAATLAGLSIANAGVTLPHGIAMTVGGWCSNISHGSALALVYPEFTRYTWPDAVSEFAFLGRLLDPSLERESDEVAAERSCGLLDTFLMDIGLWRGFDHFDVTDEVLENIALHSLDLPDYQANPRVATIPDVREILGESRQR